MSAEEETNKLVEWSEENKEEAKKEAANEQSSE